MESSLIKAAEDGDIDTLQELISSGLEDDKNDLSNALVAAAKEEKWDCVKLLVKAADDVNGGGYYKALNYASCFDNVECVDLLIKAGADVNYYNHTTALNSTRDVKVAELLIKAGANVNASENIFDDDSTPLTTAAWDGNTELVKLLIESRADVNYWSISGTPLEMAVRNNKVDCVKLLLPHVTATQEPCLLAANLGHKECMTVFLDSKLDVNAKMKIYEQHQCNTLTPLMKAASGN